MSGGGIFGGSNGYRPSMDAVGGSFAVGDDVAPLAAGFDSVNRQQQVDTAVNETNSQIQQQTGSASRTAQQYGRRFILSPLARVQAAAYSAAAGTQAGFNADNESFERRVQLAKLADADRTSRQQQANASNSLRAQYMDSANRFKLASQNNGGFGGMSFHHGRSPEENDYVNTFNRAMEASGFRTKSSAKGIENDTSEPNNAY